MTLDKVIISDSRVEPAAKARVDGYPDQLIFSISEEAGIEEVEATKGRRFVDKGHPDVAECDVRVPVNPIESEHDDDLSDFYADNFESVILNCRNDDGPEHRGHYIRYEGDDEGDEEHVVCIKPHPDLIDDDIERIYFTVTLEEESEDDRDYVDVPQWNSDDSLAVCFDDDGDIDNAKARRLGRVVDSGQPVVIDCEALFLDSPFRPPELDDALSDFYRGKFETIVKNYENHEILYFNADAEDREHELSIRLSDDLVDTDVPDELIYRFTLLDGGDDV